jgi:hypothetical protein
VGIARTGPKGPPLPGSIESPEDMARFFAHLTLVDRTSFHPDDRFFHEETGTVEYVGPGGKPAYTPREARRRDRLMGEAWDVATGEGLDIYEVAMWADEVVGTGPGTDTRPPAWIKNALKPWAVAH